MFNIGPWELGLILLVALIVVGPGKLPEVARAIGKGLHEFKKVTSGYKKEFQEALDDMDKTIKSDLSEAPGEKPSSTVTALAADFDSAGQSQTDEAAPVKTDADPGSEK